MVDVVSKVEVSGGMIWMNDTLGVFIGIIFDFVGEILLGTLNCILVGRGDGLLSESCCVTILGVFIGAVVGIS